MVALVPCVRPSHLLTGVRNAPARPDELVLMH